MNEDYYDNLMKAQDKLTDVLEKSTTERTDIEYDLWVGRVIKRIAKQFNVKECDLDEMYQYI